MEKKSVNEKKKERERVVEKAQTVTNSFKCAIFNDAKSKHTHTHIHH